MENFFSDPCFSIPSMLECKSLVLQIRTVVFISFILFYLYQFVSLFQIFFRSPQSSVRSAVYFWFFGFVTCITCQLILLNSAEFEQSPLKTFCWSLCSAFDHCPFMFMLNYLVNSYEVCQIFGNIELNIIHFISKVIVLVGFIPPIIYISVPEDSSYDSAYKFIPHFITCLMTAVSDTFFLYTMFRMFVTENAQLKPYLGNTIIKIYQRGLFILSFILFIRNGLLIVGAVPHYAYRLFFYTKDPDSMRQLFVADYCMVDFVVYVFPYVILAIGVNLNMDRMEDTESSDNHNSVIAEHSFFLNDTPKHDD